LPACERAFRAHAAATQAHSARRYGGGRRGRRRRRRSTGGLVQRRVSTATMSTPMAQIGRTAKKRVGDVFWRNRLASVVAGGSSSVPAASRVGGVGAGAAVVGPGAAAGVDGPPLVAVRGEAYPRDTGRREAPCRAGARSSSEKGSSGFAAAGLEVWARGSLGSPETGHPTTSVWGPALPRSLPPNPQHMLVPALEDAAADGETKQTKRRIVDPVSVSVAVA